MKQHYTEKECQEKKNMYLRETCRLKVDTQRLPHDENLLPQVKKREHNSDWYIVI